MCSDALSALNGPEDYKALQSERDRLKLEVAAAETLRDVTIDKYEQLRTGVIADRDELLDERDRLKARLEEADASFTKIRSFGMPDHPIACVCVFCFDIPQILEQYFANRDKEAGNAS